jgi:hypothetical protein
MALIEELTKYTVLVSMLHWLLFGHDRVEDLYWSLPTARDSTKDPQVDYIRSYGHHRFHWRCLLLRHCVPMHPNLIFL